MILILDCDNTLYPASLGIMDINDSRINLFIQERFNLSLDETNELRAKYLRQYGTTLKGLMENHHIDPEEYLDFVHSYSLEGILKPNPVLREFLGGLHFPKVVLSSANKKHVERVLSHLGILEQIDDIYDLKRVDYRGKPDPYAYKVVLRDYPNETAVFVDDRLLNFPPAKELGFVTVLVDEMAEIHGESEFAGSAIFREEARKLQAQKHEIVDFEIHFIEQLASVWHEVIRRTGMR